MRGKRKNSGRSEKMELYGRMRQRKKQKSNNKEGSGSSSSSSNGGKEGSGSRSGNGGGFHGCYLLTSLSPRYKGHTYIGYTVNPKRRIRQHNGEICSGASTTKKKRPWDMILFIHGFPSSTFALQFEWAWQHPNLSLSLKHAASSFKSLSGLANKIKLALTMLTLPSWLPLDLTVTFFSTKYMNHAAAAPSYLKLHCSSIHDLPCYHHIHDHIHPHSPPYHLLHDTDEDIHPHSPPHHLDVDADDIIHPHSPPYHHHLGLDDIIHPHSPPYHHHLGVDHTVHPHSPPSHQFSTESEETTLNHKKQKDELICVIIDDDNTQQTPAKHHTQLIDLLTPSPHNRIIGATNNPTPPSTSHHIIDLTTSPLFLQL